MEVARPQIENIVKIARTLPGTRSFHYFEPLSASMIGAKRVSEDG